MRGRFVDKVDFTSNPAALINARLAGGPKAETKKAREKSIARGNKAGDFSKFLEHSLFETGRLGPARDIPPSEEALDGLLDAVRSAGDNLKNRPLPDELLRYKEAVRDMLYYVSKNCYEVERFQTDKPWNTKIKIHVQIQVIDQKLETLAAEILTKQISELDLKSRLDDISGLLVDLTISGKIQVRKDDNGGY
jgi:uncharacterized protein YaaR (DUF327 family)